MTNRSREVALDLARRAVQHAARRAAEEAAGDDVAARLRAVADANGQLTVDAALAALSRDPNRDGTHNPFAESVARRRQRGADRVLRHYPAAPEPPDPDA